MRRSKTQPLPIHYVEDDVRRQFFRDHPFETFRPVSLTEGGEIRDEHPIVGKAWTRLRQRGRNPSPEDAIRYAVNLYHHHDIPLTEAYTRAISQFRSLRAERYIASNFAAAEAEAFGARFGPGEIEHSFEKEKKYLETWERKAELDSGALVARKRWKAIVDRRSGVEQWTQGKEYQRLWKDGVRPSYLLSTQPVVAQEVLSSAEAISRSADFLAVGRR